MSLSFAAVIAQSAPITDEAFWNQFSNTGKLDGKLTLKSKQKLADALKFALNEENKDYMQIIVNWLMCFSKFPNFLKNFTKSDQTFYSSLSSFTNHILNLNDENKKLKQDLIISLDNILKIDSVLKNEILSSISDTIIQMLKNEEDNEIISLGLKLIFNNLQNNPLMTNVINSKVNLFIQCIKKCKYPKLQLQFLNILWIIQAKTNQYSFIHTDDQQFLSTIHKNSIKSNNGKDNFIITLSFNSITLFDGTKAGNGYIDIGIDDLLICFNEQIIPLHFEAIDGLDSEDKMITIIINKSYEEFGTNPQNIIIELETKPKPKFISFLFSRISHGESQSQMNEYSESSSEEIEKPKTKPKPKAKPPKSSIALFLHPDSQKSTQIIDECLFSEEIKEENEPPSMTIEENNQMYNEEEKEIESPPIISIEMNEKSTEFIEKEKTQQDNIQEEEEKDNFLESHINQVLDKINSGINTLTRQRLEMVDHFGQKLNSIVDSLHEDIRTTLRDREHGSIKQLEISKQQFQANLQKFKRQESQMQQTLIGFENETRQMSEKIVNIQKTIRNELQNHRINLEEELKRLRKMIRTQADKSIEDDVEEYVYQKPKTRNVKRIPLII